MNSAHPRCRVRPRRRAHRDRPGNLGRGDHRPSVLGRNHDSGRYEYTHFVIANTRLAPPREFLDETLEEEGCWERLGSWPDVIAEGTQVGVRLTAAATEREQRESQNLEKLRSVVALRQF